MTDPIFLTQEQVCAFHAQSLAAFGGMAGIREISLLESALGQSLNDFYYASADHFGIAAAYAFHVAQNQPFFDGNKRTAVMAALGFLHVNGHGKVVDWTKIYDAMIAIAERRMTKAELADALRALFA